MYKKNQPNWSYQSMRDELKNFDKIYDNRPIKNNNGGMKFPQMFAVYYILKKIKPDFVIESGIFKGQSTWLIETTLPEAKILSIDINFKKILKGCFLLFCYYLKKLIDKNYTKELFKHNFYLDDVLANKNHFKMIDKIINSYYEFPPIFKTKSTRWDDCWDDINYPTEQPILNASEKDNFKSAFSEAKYYNWLCYVKLK